MSALLFCDQLMHDDCIMILHIASVSSDHSVDPYIPDIGIDFRPAPAGADIDAVSVGTRFSDRSDCGFREMICIVHQCSVNVDEKNFTHDVLRKMHSSASGTPAEY